MTHYNTLGVSKTATKDEIKQAYRTLAKQHHPDKGGDNATFQKVQEAYETLSDDVKREEYDHPPAQHSQHPFDQFFQQHARHHHHQQQHAQQTRRSRKMEDFEVRLSVPLRNAFSTIVKKCKHTNRFICKTCVQTCVMCGGVGHRVQMINPIQRVTITCTLCHGRGFTFTKRKNCSHDCVDGYYKQDSLFEVTVEPHQVATYAQRYVGKGTAPEHPNDVVGDCVVRLSVNCPHGVTLRGSKIVYQPRLSIEQVISGTSISIPNDIPMPEGVSDRTVVLAPLVGFQSCVATMKQWGLCNEKTKIRDDLIIEPEVDWKTLDEAITKANSHILQHAFSKEPESLSDLLDNVFPKPRVSSSL
jgi:DnaJ-class molecular chaperone